MNYFRTKNNDLPIFRRINSNNKTNNCGVYDDKEGNCLFKSEYTAWDDFTKIIYNELTEVCVLTKPTTSWHKDSDSKEPFTIKVKGSNKNGHIYKLYLYFLGTYQEAEEIKNYINNKRSVTNG